MIFCIYFTNVGFNDELSHYKWTPGVCDISVDKYIINVAAYKIISQVYRGGEGGVGVEWGSEANVNKNHFSPSEIYKLIAMFCFIFNMSLFRAQYPVNFNITMVCGKLDIFSYSRKC